ncbi:hypothetical protein I9W82_003800 [Candida metapsilosis]|uniref:Uncharacterized protein n=1 Tax=Candida metapsilosis TaxID=273372 RepID=A0A8H7ZAI5_9ASCO|nr:hypothetical protein I9W82_003800 [Candida metapsilosis]
MKEDVFAYFMALLIWVIYTCLIKFAELKLEHTERFTPANQRNEGGDYYEGYENWRTMQKYMINYSIGVVGKAVALFVLGCGVQSLVAWFTRNPTNLSTWVQSSYSILAKVSGVSQILGISTVTNMELNKLNPIPIIKSAFSTTCSI